MPGSDRELRATLAAAGLARHADDLLALAADSIRLHPTAEAQPEPPRYRHTPVEVSGLGASAVAVAGSVSHKLALMAEGSVMAWGSNEHGALGDGTRRDRRDPVPVRDLDGVVAVAAGASHSLALRADGSVLAWGDNSWGQLCDGTRQDRHTPVAVRDLDGGVTAMVAGDYMSLALRSDGSVVGWGVSVADKLGMDHIPDRPVQVPGLDSGIVAVATAGQYRLALADDGSVIAWGLTAERLVPTPVKGLPVGAVAIAMGGYGYHSLALISDGSLLAWGDNPHGQLGDGTTTKRPTPVAVTGLGSGVAAIAAGHSCSFAVSRDGAALAWGWNQEGQLGDGTIVDRHSPVVMAGLDSSVRALAPRVALRDDGSVVSWGGEQPADEPPPEPDLSIGTTRLGGAPDLPPGTSWPSFEDRSMAFVAQVNLADVAPLDERGLLPPAGLLSFFCSTADLHRQGSGHVTFAEAGTALTRVELPADVPSYDRFGAVGLRAERELSWPPPQSSATDGVGLSEEEQLAYRDALEADDETAVHRMLGHPDVIQHDHRDQEPGLCLLMQVDSDEAAGMTWGDMGRLYFWISPDDLEVRRFDRARLDFQCY